MAFRSRLSDKSTAALFPLYYYSIKSGYRNKLRASTTRFAFLLTRENNELVYEYCGSNSGSILEHIARSIVETGALIKNDQFSWTGKAVGRCENWNQSDDWKSYDKIKILIILRRIVPLISSPAKLSYLPVLHKAFGSWKVFQRQWSRLETGVNWGKKLTLL